jgi:hypothetical protein
MNNHYLEGKLTSVNAYSRLSAGLTDEVAKQPELSANPQAAAAISGVITPAAVQKIINSGIDQLSLYYQGKGPAPSIDLSGLGSQLQTAGMPVPVDSPLTKPVHLTPDSGTGKTAAYPGRSFASTQKIAIISALALTLALLVVSWVRHVWTPLPGVLITTGVLTGLIAAACAASSSLLAHYVRFDDASNAFAAVSRDLATAIVHDLTWRFGIIAGVLLVVGIVSRVLVRRLQSKMVPSQASGRAALQQATKIQL